MSNKYDKIQQRVAQLEDSVFGSGLNCCLCGRKATCGTGNALFATKHYCNEHRPTAFGTGIPKATIDKLMGTPDKSEPERICDKCGGKFGDTCYHMGLSKAPVPPLRVRVAKALGFSVYYQEESALWFRTRNSMTSTISHYDTDRDLAMGALEEYCRKNHCGINNIGYFPFSGDKNQNWCVELSVGYGKTVGGETCSSSISFPTAICEAIVAHSEGK